MSVTPPPLRWTTILITLAVATVVTGVAVGALGYVMTLPRWLPGAALAAVVGVLAAILIGRRNAQVAGGRR